MLNIRERKVFKAGAEVELQLLLPRLAADPGAPVEGEIWLNQTTDELKYHNGTGVVVVGANLTTEQIQDIVGPFISDSADLDATYDDAGNIVSAVIKARAVTWAKVQAIGSGKLLGRTTAGSGDVEEITPTDTATADIDFSAGLLKVNVLDSPTLGGDTKASVIAAAVAAVVGGAGAAYDTLVELQAILQADDTAIAGLLTAVAARTRFFAADLAGGATTENVDHNLALAQRGDFVARVFVKATGVAEEYYLNPTSVNRIVVTDETGGNIPAGRRIFIVAGA
jgi:hypothetical protein